MPNALSHPESHLLRLARRVARKAPGVLRNAPLFLLSALVALAIEAFAAGGIFAENTASVTIAGFPVKLAYAEAVMSVSMTLMSLALAGAAAAQKQDARPEQQRRSWATQLLAIMVLTAPVYYAGNCLALNRQLDHWREYAGSPAEAADRSIAMDASADSHARSDAAEALKQASRPLRAEFDPAATIWIAFLLSCNMLAVRLGWRAPPETKAARERRQRPVTGAQLKVVN